MSFCRGKCWLQNITAYFLFVFLFAALIFPQVSYLPLNSHVKPNVVVFAVLYDGTLIEPIGFIDDGKMTHSPVTIVENDGIGFKSLFATGRKYSLLFGGSRVGDIEIKKQFTGACTGEAAEISLKSSQVYLNGFVMALATDAPLNLELRKFRRRPLTKERASIEKLIREEFGSNGVSINSKKPLRYFNLTAIDVDHDGNAEFVGSYWSAPTPSERVMLFFIAARSKNGLYSFNYKKFKRYTNDKVMSENVEDTDDGTYHELLLDYFDIDGDGVAEIFTTTQAFEGRNFTVYRREKGKWRSIFSSYNYRCGY